jgi:hypothetical protein
MQLVFAKWQRETQSCCENVTDGTEANFVAGCNKSSLHPFGNNA